MKIKKKLKNLTCEEFSKWKYQNCRYFNANNLTCSSCLFNKIICNSSDGCWVDNKELYSDKFLDQEIEIETNIKISYEEKVLLKNLDKKYKWIARDKDNDLCIFESKPYKYVLLWLSDKDKEHGHYLQFSQYNHLFNFIKWSDIEAYSIKDLLKE